jgi:hypothetical protein
VVVCNAPSWGEEIHQFNRSSFHVDQFCLCDHCFRPFRATENWPLRHASRSGLMYGFSLSTRSAIAGSGRSSFIAESKISSVPHSAQIVTVPGSGVGRSMLPILAPVVADNSVKHCGQCDVGTRVVAMTAGFLSSPDTPLLSERDAR